MHSTLVTAGAEVPYDTVAKMVNAVDSDGSGEIDFDEFLTIMQTCVTSVPEYSFKVPAPKYLLPGCRDVLRSIFCFPAS